jgi:CRP-like cAMP-binding protein
MRQTASIQLENIPLLAGVHADALAQMMASVQYKNVDRGHYVLNKGSAGDHLLFVLSGRLQAVDLTEDGREIGLNFLSPGDYFGELSIIDGLPRSSSVVAIENSLIGSLPRAQALELIYKSPLLAERLLKRMAASIRTASSYRTIIGIPSAFQRVFTFLNQLAKVAPGGLVVINKMPTQQEIAITLNTSRETVSRALNTLIQRGVVEKDRRRLIVRNPDALSKAASSETGGLD